MILSMTGYLLRCYITNNDEGSCQQEVNSLAEGCTETSLLLCKTKELIVYFRKKGQKHIPQSTSGELINDTDFKSLFNKVLSHLETYHCAAL